MLRQQERLGGGARKPPPASESPVRTGVLGKRLPRELAESLRKVLNRPRGPLLLSCSGTHHAPPPPPPVHPWFAPTPLPPPTAHSCFQDACRAHALGAGRRDLSPNLPAPQTQGPGTGGAAGPWSLILPSLVPGPHASRCRGGGHLQGAPVSLRPSAQPTCAPRSCIVPPAPVPTRGLRDSTDGLCVCCPTGWLLGTSSGGEWY